MFNIPTKPQDKVWKTAKNGIFISLQTDPAIYAFSSSKRRHVGQLQDVLGGGWVGLSIW